ncbi:hypothetical protein E2C01_038764 [Portunus trituberculatus]|uniref:Uncharacterized protein n=1 Tax=Portunus trituberculatus TaxID=210409 RepID=A0A5B7FBN9_PORTR|nr:hypothetical protein [Portunus trituberculatus]
MCLYVFKEEVSPRIAIMSPATIGWKETRLSYVIELQTMAAWYGQTDIHYEPFLSLVVNGFEFQHIHLDSEQDLRI